MKIVDVLKMSTCNKRELGVFGPKQGHYSR
jgi:hypothetical protein